MIVPLALTLWFSFQNYNLVVPTIRGFAGFDNYTWLLTDPALWTAMLNTLLLVGGVLILTVVLGVLLAVLFDQEFFGCGIARLLAIAPFFVMPTVSALIWKNMLMHPVNGLFAWITKSLGLGTIDWFANLPLTAIIIIVAWQWTPFALLILLTAIQSLDNEQKEAARMDGAGPLSMFWFLHPTQPISFSPDLKPGIDMVGGTSLIYEIKAPEENFTGNLADEVMQSLKTRVDPDGVRNLIWRPQGNRLEIQMPMTAKGKQAKALRETFAEAQGALEQTNIRLAEVKHAVETLSGEQRTAKLNELAAGSTRRADILSALRALAARIKAARDARYAARKKRKAS